MTSPYAISLSQFAPFGSRTYVQLFEHFETYADIWNASAAELTAVGLSEKLVTRFVAWRGQVDPSALVDAVNKLGLQTIDHDNPLFPAALKTIYDPPIILYVQGQLPSSDQLIGIVGSREATAYGLRTATLIATDLARAGLVVVSGLARGIDTAAHQGAMSAGGKTIAVIAHGHTQLAGSKRQLADQIVAQGGAIISEQPPSLKAQNYHFPIRNRIIAGLSRGVVIVEAGLPSGTLHTAQAALNADRAVFAVPGPIDSPSSAGSNKLIQDGAHLITHSHDVLEVLGIASNHVPTKPILVAPTTGTAQISLSAQEQQVLAQISSSPIHVDELTHLTGQTPAEILGTLTILEIHGKVHHLGGQFYTC